MILLQPDVCAAQERQTVLHAAIAAGYTSIIEQLFFHFKDFVSTLIEAKDKVREFAGTGDILKQPCSYEVRRKRQSRYLCE